MVNPISACVHLDVQTTLRPYSLADREAPHGDEGFLESAMARYQLLPNEVVLLNDDAVTRRVITPCELMLTNLNLVVTGRGVFGSSKSFEVFPIRQIKTHNGQAQALLGSMRGAPALAVYFLHGEEQFRFANGGTSKIQAWAAKINEAVTGQPASVAPPQRPEGAFGMLAEQFKEAFGSFKVTPAPPAPVRVASKCGFCGAPIAGVRGQTAKCDYCDGVQQL